MAHVIGDTEGEGTRSFTCVLPVQGDPRPTHGSPREWAVCSRVHLCRGDARREAAALTLPRLCLRQDGPALLPRLTASSVPFRSRPQCCPR